MLTTYAESIVSTKQMTEAVVYRLQHITALIS